jgi:two-component system response regulator NreC
MEKIKILIVDDHALVRAGIKSLLVDVPEIEVISEAESGKEAKSKIAEQKPDIILLDISMPDINGLELAEYIKNNIPDIKIIILTMHENEEYYLSAMKKGVNGMLFKSITKKELIQAIKTVADNKVYFDSVFSQKIKESFQANLKQNNSDNPKETVLLTKREREILKHIARGLSNLEIADQLSISPRTVETHKTNLMQKLNIKTAHALYRFAFENIEV